MDSIQLDRYMVNLFFEIKRNLPHAAQGSMLISNPNLGAKLIELYRQSKDENLKLLIEVFMERAGSKWRTQLKPKKSEVMLKKLAVAVKPAVPVKPAPKGDKSQGKARYYRGVRID